MADKNFSQKLKELRLKAGYSQKDVYEHFKIPQSTFSSWEVGKSEPSGLMLIKLFEFYKCDIINKPPEQNKLNSSELKLIQSYRQLDSHGKRMVDIVINEEIKRISNNNTNYKLDYLTPVAAHNDLNTDDEIIYMNKDIQKIKKLSNK